MTKGIKGYNSPKDKPDIEPEMKKKVVIDIMAKVKESLVEKKANALTESFKNLYLKAMYDLNNAGVINFLDRDLIEWAVGEDKPFASYTALGDTFGFYPAEISNIRSGVRKMKSARIRIMLNKLEEIKRNG